MKYRAIMNIELKFPLWLLCEIAGISRSSYYKYKNKPVDKNTDINNKIIDIFQKSNKRAGYRTICQTLRYKYNLTVNHKKVLRIMQENNIKSIVRQKFKKPKETAIIKENLLNRNFKASKPGEKFVTDITYIPTPRKMIYLCVVIDLFNNEPVAWNLSDSQDKNLSLNAIKALSKRYSLEDCIVHSDQGVHFTNKEYVDLLKRLKITQSMSRKGNCWDNASVESFFSHYKCEAIHIMSRKIKNYNDVEAITDEYMDYYINQRPQKKLGGVPPSIYKQKVS